MTEMKFKHGQVVYFLAHGGFFRCKIFSIRTPDIRNTPPVYHLIGDSFEIKTDNQKLITDDYNYACSLYA